MRVFKNAWFGRFAQKARISDNALRRAVGCAEQGLIDADLGGGVIKQRIARPGGSKAKGFRAVVLYRKGDRAFFVYGFSKNQRGNMREDEEAQFKRAARAILDLSDEQISRLIGKGQLEEVS